MKSKWDNQRSWEKTTTWGINQQIFIWQQVNRKSRFNNQNRVIQLKWANNMNRYISKDEIQGVENYKNCINHQETVYKLQWDVSSPRITINRHYPLPHEEQANNNQSKCWCWQWECKLVELLWHGTIYHMTQLVHVLCICKGDKSSAPNKCL